MTLPVEFSAEAEEDLHVAALWFNEQRPELGSEFLEATDEVVGLIAKWPGTGSIVEDVPADLEVRRAPVSRFRFHIGYSCLTIDFECLQSHTITASLGTGIRESAAEAPRGLAVLDARYSPVRIALVGAPQATVQWISARIRGWSTAIFGDGSVARTDPPPGGR